MRTGSLQPLALTQQPAQVVLPKQSDKSDITESTIRLIRVSECVRVGTKIAIVEVNKYFSHDKMALR